MSSLAILQTGRCSSRHMPGSGPDSERLMLESFPLVIECAVLCELQSIKFT
jgi:hypothetical protein